MAAIGPQDTAFNSRAPDFRLPATDGKTYTLSDIAGEKGTVIVFICNHCPYVIAVIDRLVADARPLLAEGFGFAAICSNDAKAYPEDSFPNMKGSRRSIASRSPICMTRARPSPVPMMPSARRISSASTGI